jgi:hypothetical protein
MKDTTDHTTARSAVLRTILRILFIALVVISLHKMMSWTLSVAELDQNGPLMVGLVFIILAAYIILISIPFVPGIEIALSLMMLRGPEVVIWVYIATVLGLFLSFLAGQYLSYKYLHKIFHDLQMKRACQLIENIQPLSKIDRLNIIKDKLPILVRPFIVEGRYAAVAAILNIPGNALIGGGGGILLIAGLSRIFSTFGMLLTLIIAVAPVPIAILVFDIDPMAYLR